MTEDLRKLYSQAIILGMSYQEYWLEEPELLDVYIEAFKQKNDNQNLIRDEQAWLNGLYVAKAIGANFAKNSTYPEKPIYAGDKMEEANSVNGNDEERAIEKSYQEMLIFSSKFNANRKGA